MDLYVFFNAWQSSNGTYVAAGEAKEEKVDLEKAKFFTNNETGDCPWKEHRIESVILSSGIVFEASKYETIVIMDTTTSIISISNYTGVSVSDFTGLKIKVQSRTVSLQTTSEEFLALNVV
jgi:hypothetical protein